MAGELAECEAAKAAGNDAVRRKDYADAVALYSRALKAIPAAGDNNMLRATIFCNRSLARHQCEEWHGAAEDATSALESLPPQGPEIDKMRVKALYRRALAQEASGVELRSAFLDLNQALKLAPSNEGIVSAAKRIQAILPPEEPTALEQGSRDLAWKPTLEFDSQDIEHSTVRM
eukprot:gnl/TRDRNA2_/TRDRNA2_158744_c0_seq2.p1 gnl/TRDRNA2_/TRDRNA2_158744_c0~~gnl/TRDRNA2_/TRDRNA2_158744_c0_seq2.p1  ORF type:complete len:175 (+),score=42.32 gnl/TRDRNA2_/TRDRNA2_158744_c0_seq2:106-630(+)